MIGAAIFCRAFENDCTKCHTLPDWKRAQQGCDGPTVAPVARLLDGTALHECPQKMVTIATARALSVYQLFEAGVLPSAGALLDQSATWFDAMKCIGAEVGRYREKAAK